MMKKRAVMMICAALFALSTTAPAFAGQESSTPEVLYQPVLNGYEEVINTSLKGGDAVQLGESCGLNRYWLNSLPYSFSADVRYAFYDIDQNGTKELFIQNDCELFDAFGYDGNKAVRLLDTSSRGKMTVYQDGLLEVYAYGGQSSVYRFYRMAADGHTMEKVDELIASFGQYSRNGMAIAETDLYRIINDYEKTPKAQISWSRLPNVVYRGSCPCIPELEKKNGIYQYSGTIIGYKEPATPYGDPGAGFYDLISGDLYVDHLTKVVIETERDYGNYGFPATGKTATEWLDDFYARRDYWMTFSLKIRGDHIEEILGVYSID